MNRPPCLRLVRVAAVLVAFANGGLSGCAFPRRCGDAFVTEPSRNFGRQVVALGMLRKGYAVQLPTVSLSKAGTTVFNVQDLPPGSYDYNFFITGGALRGRKPSDGSRLASPAELPADLAGTVATFRATTPAGTTILDRETRLARVNWALGDSTLYGDVLPAVRATDYHLAITVAHPSALAGVTMHIEAFCDKSREDVVQVR